MLTQLGFFSPFVLGAHRFLLLRSEIIPRNIKTSRIKHRRRMHQMEGERACAIISQVRYVESFANLLGSFP